MYRKIIARAGRCIPFVTLLACLLTLGLAWAGTPGEVPVGERLRDVRMDGLSGPAKNLSAYLGKPLVINVWASWCGPCRQEMPSLVRLANRFNGRQFNVIGISTDDYPEKAFAFLEQAGIGFDNYIDRRLVLENMLGANKLPLTLLVDNTGKVLDKHYGALDWNGAEARQRIEKAFRIRW